MEKFIIYFVLVFGIISFLKWFLIPFRKTRLSLKVAINGLKQHKKDPNKNLESLFKDCETLSHLWAEYRDTLHEQKRLNNITGNYEVAAIRSTVPAEVYFKTDVVVDTTLNVDFFKHLPGIFTGIGIIGTFLGILHGLHDFKISDDTNLVRQSLQGLLGGVTEAFSISCIAISLAMLITLIEKICINLLNKDVEDLVQLIDGLYSAGSGEEYLARLVKSSEESAGQMGILKDTLVEKLKDILTELTERQIQATQQSFSENLSSPINKMATSFEAFKAGNGDAVSGMMKDVMAAFLSKTESLFSGQINGINELQRQTAESLNVALANIEKAAKDIQNAGSSGAEAMSGKLSDAMEKAERRQSDMEARMKEFLNELKKISDESSQSSQQKMQSSLDALTETMMDFTDKIILQVKGSADIGMENNEKIRENIKVTVGEMGGQVSAVVEGVGRAVSEMNAAVQSLKQTSTEAFTKMHNGAETLSVTMSEFNNAGQNVLNTLQKSVQLTNDLAKTSGDIATVSQAFTGVSGSYKETTEKMSHLVNQMNQIVETAQREAGATSQIVSTIERASQTLVEAQYNADQYLQRVNHIITEAHGRFTEGMTRAVDEANRSFHESINTAVNMLSGSIQSLSITIDELNDKNS